MSFYWCRYRAKLFIRDLVSFICFMALRVKGIFVRDQDKGIRVLVYHSIREMQKTKDPLRITVPPQLFEKQIKYLLFWNYKILPMEGFLDYMSGHKRITGKEVVLTFDDGFDDNFEAALNILKKNATTATYFLISNYSLKKVLRAISMNVSIGSHSWSHINLADLSHDKDRLYQEITMSKKDLEGKLKVPVSYFAYPIGSKGTYNRITESIVRKSGYKAAFTNVLGWNKKGDNIFALKRTRITWNDTLFKFKMKLEGAYDWVDSLGGFLKG